MYISKTNKSAYWTVRAAHSGTMQLFLEGVVEKYAGWKVEASVEETVTWAASRTARIAWKGLLKTPIILDLRTSCAPRPQEWVEPDAQHQSY